MRFKNKDSKLNDSDNQTKEETQRKITRRDFLKYSAGVAAVAAGAGTLLGGLPLPSSTTSSPQARSNSNTRLVVMVNGDELTVMSGDSEKVVKDAGLASAIAGKME